MNEQKEECPICQNMRMVITPEGARQCECVKALREARLIAAANIPPRYEHSTLESYEANYPGANSLLFRALLFAQKFAANYPTADKGQGLLITGTIGTGKTHLAIGIMRALVEAYAVPCAFFDYHALLTEIRRTYEYDAETSERAIVAPVLTTEVIVIDDIGNTKYSTWQANTISEVITHRYNHRLTTILTTNFPNLPAGQYVEIDKFKESKSKADRRETLGDRITDRLHSRLAEMCIELHVEGTDFRQSIGKARL